MQKEILKALGENPRVAKELTTYLRGIGIDVNKFVLEDSLPNKMFHLFNFFTTLYKITIEFYDTGIIINKGRDFIDGVVEDDYNKKVEMFLVRLINYCEKPF